MVESIEFPHLANKYSVYGVPRTVINETTFIEGGAPEPLLIAKVQEAMGMITAAQVEKVVDMLSDDEANDRAEALPSEDD